jgi:hypothetical protein
VAQKEHIETGMSNPKRALTLAGLFLLCLLLTGVAYNCGAPPIFALLAFPVMVSLFSTAVIFGNKG